MARTFSYFKDPLFLVACASYALNNVLVKPVFEASFFHYWFNDFLLIPCALPVLLFTYRKLGLRKNDSPPQGREVLSILLFWSVLFEGFGPLIISGTVADPLDVCAYSIGAIIAFIFWHRHRFGLLRFPLSPPPLRHGI